MLLVIFDNRSLSYSFNNKKNKLFNFLMTRSSLVSESL